jgi:hypothetical protein
VNAVQPSPWDEVDATTAVVLLAYAGVLRALIALASKLADRQGDTPQ